MALTRSRRLSFEEGFEALNRLRVYVGGEVYERARVELENSGKRVRKIVASRPYPLRIPESLLSLVDSKASEDRTDRSTALRQLLYTGAGDYVIELLKRERISASRAAELLDVSLYKMHELMRESGVKVDAGSEGYDSRQETADRLLG